MNLAYSAVEQYFWGKLHLEFLLMMHVFYLPVNRAGGFCQGHGHHAALRLVEGLEWQVDIGTLT